MLFISRLKAGESMTELCREYGISRKTGYKFLERFERLGPQGLFDVSRRPHRLAKQSPEALRELFLEARRAHPTWGPKKLRTIVGEKQPGVPMPAASTVNDWLVRAGLVKKRKRTLRVAPYEAALRKASTPNEVWCVDYKGQFRLGNGMDCYPLTVTDHFSRYLLSCEGFERIDGRAARAVFEQLFEEHGLPDVIRSDNGSPFAARGLFGLTQLSVFWLKMGVIPERIEPGHPEQNGRHERMHRTLKAEATRPAGLNLLQQQERFDAFIQEYNEVRPHEALEQKRPAAVYRRSERRPAATELSYPFHDEVVKVSSGGHAHVLHRRKGNVFVSSALAGERIGLRELPNGEILLTFAKLDLGYFDPDTGRLRRADAEPEPHAEFTAFQSPPGPPSTTDHHDHEVLPMSPV
jgi:transposase InsO family protein